MPTVTGQLLALNVGSSSVKFAVFDTSSGELAPRALGHIEALGVRPRLEVRGHDGTLLIEHEWRDGDAPADPLAALDTSFDWLAGRFPDLRPQAIGHRVVMGGAEFVAPVVLDDAVLARLQALSPLAPLHQPACLAGIRAARRLFPQVPQVACLDTAFHRRQPFVNDTFALPRRFYDEGVRRYGFHGLSYEYVSGRLAQIAPHHANARTIIAHLGNGASMCAMRDGLSVASTMGFSALDGLPMGTRCGQIDPGVLLWMMEARGMDAAQISQVLYRESGLKGLSGASSDMRDLEASDAAPARQAIDYFVFRARREIGGMAAALGGVDAIVFTGGIGEHSVRIRRSILEGMEWIGVELDPDANARSGRTAAAGAPFADGLISSRRSRVQVWVIPTDEETTIARHTLRALELTQPA